MPELAQTNVQLCRQLVALGWNDDDLVALRRAYELVMWLFSGQYRANGKTQLAHHIGVASALGAAGAEPVVVRAGLVHAAYFHGEFGHGRLAVNADKRVRVQESVGLEVEALVDAYTNLAWDGMAVRDLVDRAQDSTPPTRDIVAMRIANEVDELADAVGQYCAEDLSFGLDEPEWLALLDELAVAYELDGLRELLQSASAQGAAAPVPAALVSTTDHSVFVAPASHRRRIHVVLQDSRLGHEVAARVPGARALAERVRRVVR